MGWQTITYSELTARYAGVEQALPLYQIDTQALQLVAYVPLEWAEANDLGVQEHQLQGAWPGYYIEIIAVAGVPAAQNHVQESA